ncbi:MAG: tyrosine protein phosphatase, partial [Thermoleophilia bacterium]|nr:tyrosine protein phosphatase [Thermoleophilia bacterium]
MTINRRRWLFRGLIGGLAVLACEQTWRHSHEYIFAEEFAEVEAGRLYRGAWQKPWPMRRIVRDYKIKTVVALAHPPTHPLALQEKGMSGELGYKWVHIPIVD